MKPEWIDHHPDPRTPKEIDWVKALVGWFIFCGVVSNIWILIFIVWFVVSR